MKPWMRILWAGSVLAVVWLQMDPTERERILNYVKRKKDLVMDAPTPEPDPSAGSVRAMMDDVRRITEEGAKRWRKSKPA